MRKPDLKLRTRVRIYPQHTMYRDSCGIIHRYVKWNSDRRAIPTMLKIRESEILIFIYYIWFRLLRWRV